MQAPCQAICCRGAEQNRLMLMHANQSDDIFPDSHDLHTMYRCMNTKYQCCILLPFMLRAAVLTLCKMHFGPRAGS